RTRGIEAASRTAAGTNGTWASKELRLWIRESTRSVEREVGKPDVRESDGPCLARHRVDRPVRDLQPIVVADVVAWNGAVGEDVEVDVDHVVGEAAAIAQHLATGERAGEEARPGPDRGPEAVGVADLEHQLVGQQGVGQEGGVG